MVKQQTSNKQKGGFKQIEPRWQPGESGNPNGRPKNSVTTLLKEKDTQKIADKLYEMMLNGELGAIKEYLDRVEGKVVDKHLNVNIIATPESILDAQERLLNAQSDTKLLLEKYPKRITNATEQGKG